MQPLAQKNINDVLRQLSNLSSEKRHNVFVLRSFEQDARKLIQGSDPVRGYILLGAVSALRLERDNMHHYHKNAISLAPKTPDPYINYSVSLAKMGFFSEARDNAVIAYELNKNHLESLDNLIVKTILIGNITEALELAEKWTGLTQKTYPLCQFLNPAVTIMEENRLWQNKITELFSIISAIIIKFNSYLDVMYSKILGKKEKIIHFGFILDEPTDNKAELPKSVFNHRGNRVFTEERT